MRLVIVKQEFMDFLYLIIALAFCISVHESAHAWMAYKLGDPTAKNEGRISLNPLRHLDPLGFLMIFLVHFGWGKPVPFNYHYLKHPRRDTVLIAMAGPASNLLTAFVIGIVFKHIPDLHPTPLGILTAIFSLSIVLFLFNMIPIAPLDGSKLLALFIPAKQENRYQEFLAKGPMILILFILGDRLVEGITGFSALGTFLGYGYEGVTFLIFLAG